MNGGYCDEHKVMISKGDGSCAKIDKLQEEIDERLWPEVDTKLKTRNALMLLGIFVSALLIFVGGQFTVLYNQGNSTIEQMGEINEKVEELKENITEKIHNISVEQAVLNKTVETYMNGKK